MRKTPGVVSFAQGLLGRLVSLYLAVDAVVSVKHAVGTPLLLDGCLTHGPGVGSRDVGDLAADQHSS